jgi:hypothetical protein
MKEDELKTRKPEKIQVRRFLFSGFPASKFFLMLWKAACLTINCRALLRSARPGGCDARAMHPMDVAAE